MNLVDVFAAVCEEISSRGDLSPSGIGCLPREDVIMPATIPLNAYSCLTRRRVVMSEDYARPRYEHELTFRVELPRVQSESEPTQNQQLIIHDEKCRAVLIRSRLRTRLVCPLLESFRYES